MSRFIVQGGVPLKGTVTVSGSKNAALPIVAATVLIQDEVVLKNVPDIEDIHTMVHILEELGARVLFEKRTLKINTASLKSWNVQSEKARKLRASLLLAGPLLGRFQKASLPYPGGCVIGKRPIDSHLSALKKLGVTKTKVADVITLEAKRMKGNRVVMSEISVTATENAIMAAVLASGKTEIRLAAAEPHVEDLCKFLVSMGAKISGIGSHNIIIEGVARLHGGEYTITSDYLEAGTLLLAGILTRGKVTVENIYPEQLDSYFNKLDEIGVKYSIKDHAVTVYPTKVFKAPTRVESRTFPGFPTDLQAPFSVLLTQCNGVSKIFETLFEGRLNYLFELEKMGAKVEVLNPHQAIIVGPCKLRGVPVSSLDLRAGAAMVLAALIAKGTTEISNILYIDRGYDDLEGKLKKLGAKIQRKE